MALRSTYDTGEYGSGLYGQPETTQFAAATVLNITASCSADTVKNVSAATSISVTSSVSGIRIADGANAASTGFSIIASVSAVTSDSVSGFRDGYGRNTYGTFMYGQNESIEESSVNTAFGISATVNSQVTRNVSASTGIAITASVGAVYDIVGSVNASISISPNISYNRVRLFSAAADVAGQITVTARYKWLPESEPSTTWTPADFLERAA